MPRYDFRCPECGHESYQEVPMSEIENTVMLCIACTLLGARFVVMKRVWSAVPAIFRGGGWASKS